MSKRRLLPEWHPQWGILLAWPDDHTDWAGQLAPTRHTYLALLKALLDHESVLLVCRDGEAAETARTLIDDNGADSSRLRIRIAEYNDTWARDFGPIGVQGDGAPLLLDFRFTGWGGKFEAGQDNLLSRALPWQVALQSQDLVLEGGAIDTDGRGNLLTTRACLRNPNRNPTLDQTTLEQRLRETLGVEHIWWLDHGHLEGDDTDAHVDTLARFVNATTIAYVHCDDPTDSHYPALSAMQAELRELAQREGLTLVPLPMCTPQFNRQGERLPATYANFLITNRKILVPLYDCDSDAAALSTLSAAAGDRQVQGIPCRPLIEQGGSLHCITMQLPQGVLA